MFGLIQDGTPVTAAANLGLLGRLPNQESLLLVGKSGNAFHSFADLSGASIGIGPQESGTAYLMRQLFEDRICAGSTFIFYIMNCPNRPSSSVKASSISLLS
jgi:hypothetical protein